MLPNGETFLMDHKNSTLHMVFLSIIVGALAYLLGTRGV